MSSARIILGVVLALAAVLVVAAAIIAVAPYLAVLLVVAGIVWYFLHNDEQDPTNQGSTLPTTTTPRE